MAAEILQPPSSESIDTGAQIDYIGSYSGSTTPWNDFISELNMDYYDAYSVYGYDPYAQVHQNVFIPKTVLNDIFNNQPNKSVCVGSTSNTEVYFYKNSDNLQISGRDNPSIKVYGIKF